MRRPAVPLRRPAVPLRRPKKGARKPPTILLFMKNGMYKMQLMIDTLQTEELDVSGALLVMAGTKESLERIRKSESGVNNEVQAACSFVKQFDVDADYEFRKIYRKRVPARRLDEAPETAADLTMARFYRKEVFTFVDIMSSVLSSKISSLEDSFRPLIDVLDPNKTPSTDKVVKLGTVFPEDAPDSGALFAEIEVFFSHCDKEKAKREEPFTLTDAADFQSNVIESTSCIQMLQKSIVCS